MITPTELRELANQLNCRAKTEFQKEIDNEVDRLLTECKRHATGGARFKTLEYYCEYDTIRQRLGVHVDKIMLRVIQQKLEVAGYKVSLNTHTYQYITISW